MRRILFDLTDLEGWHGHHGGTQRVVYGVAKQLFLSQDEAFQVEFIAFSAPDNVFYQTSFEPIYQRTEAQLAAAGIQDAQPAITLQARVKQSIQTYVPASVRKNKYARASAKKALWLGKGALRKARQKMHEGGQSLRSSSPRSKVTFTKNDIVLVLGKPWDSPTMERALINEKAKAGFTLVQFIHDLIIPLYPQLHHPSLFKNFTQYAFEATYGSDLILCNSKSTEKDLKIFADKLNLPMPKTKVIRLADEIIDLQDNTQKPDGRIADKFILCVGTIEIRKNHTLLYYAYKLAESRGIKLPQLVIVGSRGWLTGDFQYLVEHDPKVKDKIIILDNINDQGLAWLYTNSLFSVYPSFYEGWGLPVAEALANGKMCIASQASSIPEIGGDLIDYFSPYNAQECLDLIVKYLDPVLLKQKETQIQKQYVPTSWSDTSKEVIEGLQKIV